MLNTKEKEEAKRITEIAVLEIIEICSYLEPYLGFNFWQQVKKEIEIKVIVTIKEIEAIVIKKIEIIKEIIEEEIEVKAIAVVIKEVIKEKMSNILFIALILKVSFWLLHYLLGFIQLSRNKKIDIEATEYAVKELEDNDSFIQKAVDIVSKEKKINMLRKK